MTGDEVVALVTTCVGVFGSVVVATRLARQDTRDFVEVQHAVWEETRAQLEDCRTEVARLRGP